MKKLFVVLAAVLLLVIMACSSKGGDSSTPATYTISGTVTQGTSTSALSGVTVNLTGTATASTTTDGSGNYSFTGQGNGSYTVTPSLSGYMFSPASPTVVVNGNSVTNTNFAAISDVFAGIQEPSDPGGSMGTPPICISSSVVSLEQKVKAAATTTTVTCNRTVDPSVVSYTGTCNDDTNNPPQCIDNQLTCSAHCQYKSTIFNSECVLSVRKFYVANYSFSFPGIGGDEGAYQLWTNYPPPSDKMMKIPKAAGNSPQADDMIVFDKTSDIKGMELGHVAVVVSLQGNILTIVDSNMLCGNAGAMHDIPMDAYTNILGWYRPIVNNVTAGPTAPTGLTAVAVSPNQINLSWVDNANDNDGFYVYSSTNNVDYTLINTVGANTTSVNINNFLPCITFFFRVVAYKGTNFSAPAFAIATTESPSGIPITELAYGLMYAFGGGMPHSIAIDSNYVYWFDNDYNGEGWIYKTPIGGGYSSLVANNFFYPVTIAVDNNSVYWIENNLANGTPTGAGGALKKISLSDGTITILAPLIYAQYMVLDANSIYFVNWNPNYGSADLDKISKNGGSLTILASGSYTSIGLGIAVDNNYVYFLGPGSSYGTGNINTVPINGGNPSVIGAGSPQRFTMDGTNLYWTDEGRGTINKMAKTGGSVTTLASGLNSPVGIKTDGINVYWIESANPGAVKKVSVSGSGAVTEFSTYGNTLGIEVDGTNVYWAESYIQGNGFIKKAPK